MLSPLRQKAELIAGCVLGTAFVISILLIPDLSAQASDGKETQSVVINEIMYHPGSENTAEEFIELYNPTSRTVELQGWRFTRGIDFTFGKGRLLGHAYLVIAADPAGFRVKYPQVTNVVGGWSGRLSNNDEEIELADAIGNRVDRVWYADEGDWAVRQRGPLDNGHYGWEWYAPHDGSALDTSANTVVGDRSLELANPSLPNHTGQNWGASRQAGGTPGSANSISETNSAPLILDLAHYPLVPGPADPVVITVRLVDEQPAGLLVTLHYRNHSTTSPAEFSVVSMFDDGSHQDGIAGDGLFAAVLPPNTNGAIIEFYVEAADAQSNRRTWPPGARQLDGSWAQTANALFQVDQDLAGPYLGTQPIYRIIMTQTENQELIHILRDHPWSNAEMNATFITFDGVEETVRYQASIRIRGSGTRFISPANNRIHIPSDRRWKGLTAINLNTAFIHAQLMGSVLSLKSGLPAANTRIVQFRINGENRARSGVPYNGSSPGSGFGSYVLVEPLNGDWAKAHFPNDGNGNVYGIGAYGWFLEYRGEDPSAYMPGYVKGSNQSENDYTDIIRLCQALSSGLPEAAYLEAVGTNVNVQMWMRYFALCTLMGYSENGLPTGYGDDYALYHGMVDPRFLLIPRDFDTILGEGDYSILVWGTSASIWLPADRYGCQVPFVKRFLKHNDYVPIYLREIQHLTETVFSSQEMNATLELNLGEWVPQYIIERMKTFAAERRQNVLSQIPRAFSIEATLPVVNGCYQATNATIELRGTANALTTRWVNINGNRANWLAWQGQWNGSVSLSPGCNSVCIRCLDEPGTVMAQTNVAVWYDDGSASSLSGSLNQDMVLHAADGPFRIESQVRIEAGSTLTIEPGTSLLFSEGARLIVFGCLRAEGIPDHRIRFTRSPSTMGKWAAIQFWNASGEQRLVEVDIDHAGANGEPCVSAVGSHLYLDRVIWHEVSSQLLDLENCSLVLRRSTLPSLDGARLARINQIPVEGRALIQENTFGTTTGNHDILEITGGSHPGAVAEIQDNTFSGGSDDILQLNGSDAHIEGNLFLHAHQDAVRADASHAISAGRDGMHASDLTIVRNIFHDCDHALLLAEGASALFANNTVFVVRTNAMAAELASVFNLAESGAGLEVSGNILWSLDGDRLLIHQTVEMDIQVHHSIMPGPIWPGEGNLNEDPRFHHPDAATISPGSIREDLALKPGSPAIGSGLEGLDRGALIPSGAIVHNLPAPAIPLTELTVQVCGPGIRIYRYSLNNGDLSSESPLSTPIHLSGLSNGVYTLRVWGKNTAGSWQEAPAQPPSWTVDLGRSGLRLNEILARNDSFPYFGSQYPDLIELFNGGPDRLDLGGFRLTDDPSLAAKYVFPTGTTLGAGQYLVLYADHETALPGLHLGFKLDQDGDGVYLIDASGGVLDSLVFGSQLPDYSMGRMDNGDWVLTQPTFGQSNQVARTGNVDELRINEWFGASAEPGSEDFVELMNRDTLPINLGGLFLSDVPESTPSRHQVAPLTFIARGGLYSFIADGDAGKGANHLSFRLPAEQGIIGLFRQDQAWIDCVVYGPQTNGISMGRSPNGSSSIAYFTTPTPGAPNPPFGLNLDTRILINEVMANNHSLLDIGMPNPDRHCPEWIELYNPTAETVDLWDLSLTDNVSEPRKFVFPKNTLIPPGGFKVILCEGDESATATNAGFGIKANGDALYLFDRIKADGQSGVLLDSIQYGIQPVDYSIGRVPNGSVNWTLTLPTAGSRNIPANLGTPSALKINEWMANPSSGADWLEIFNPNPQPVALGGVSLTDDISTPETRLKFPIPPLSFIGTGAYGYSLFYADDNPSGGADHVNFELSQNGETIALYRSPADPIDTVAFPRQFKGISEGRFPDGSDGLAGFSETQSPGAANYLLLTNIVINEVLAHGEYPLEDAIELRNCASLPLDLSGWYLSDDPHELRKYRIPLGTWVLPGALVVFYETNFSLDPTLTAPLRLEDSKNGELFLSSSEDAGSSAGRLAVARYGVTEKGVSCGRFTNSVGSVSFVPLNRPTLGVDDPRTLAEFRKGRGAANAYPKVGPVVINEIMYHPPDLHGNDNLRDEFIELRNISLTNVILSAKPGGIPSWQLRNAVEFEFPANTSIPPGGTLVVVGFDPQNEVAAGAEFRGTYGISSNTAIVGPYSGQLGNGGDCLELYQPVSAPLSNGAFVYMLVEKVSYEDASPWPLVPDPDGGGASLTRLNGFAFGDDPGNWVAALPTPGRLGLSADGDGDGMPDDWENLYGLNPLYDEATGDLDRDGASNLDEYRAGTDPRNPQSRTHLAVHHSDQVSMTFLAIAGRAYAVRFKDSVADTAWTLLRGFPSAPENRQEVFVVPATNRMRFYQLLLESWPVGQ